MIQAALPGDMTPNPSIEPTATGKPVAAAHVKRLNVSFLVVREFLLRARNGELIWHRHAPPA